MKKVLFVYLLLVACSVAHAQSQSAGDDGEGMHHGHSPIAAACEGKPVGTEVPVTFKDGKSHTIQCGVHHHHHHEDGGASTQ